MKKLLGWLLFLLGGAGIIVNIIFVVTAGSSSWMLVINTVFCLIFLFGGWRLAHPKEVLRGGMLQ